MIQYYQRPFLEFSSSLKKGDINDPHLKRYSFWRNVPDNIYTYDEAKEIVDSYYIVLVDEIEKIISSRSRMYWMHLSRRIAPNITGSNNTPLTILICRLILDASYEKYGLSTFCNSIGILGKDTEVSDVLDGLLMSQDYKFEREMLENSPNQIVLTRFNINDYIGYYNLEMLAYEIWKCGATLRSLSKGAKLLVEKDTPEMYYDIRSEEQKFLIQNYDDRQASPLVNKKGVVMEGDYKQLDGKLLIPNYNVQQLKSNLITDAFEEIGFDFKIAGNSPTNFIPTTYPIRGYYKNNQPLYDEFKRQNGVDALSILAVITSVVYRITNKLVIEKDLSMVKPLLFRGYDGPFKESKLKAIIEEYLPFSKIILELDDNEYNQININLGFEYLKLSETDIINLLYPGPLKLFIPVHDNMIMVDYVKLPTILHNLMFGIRINNENFKGKLLEIASGSRDSFLPTKPCIANDGSKKQIDFAFSKENILVICECKLKEISIGYFKGSKISLEARRIHVVDKSINEVDKKARWLAKNPQGRNYDLSQFRYILPLGISGYKEYIHTKDKKYWVTSKLPRVVTVEELNNIIIDKINLGENCWNLVPIKA